MDIRHLQIACAVGAESHNPSILNLDFLYNHKIIEKEWGWEDTEKVTLPMLSFVRFKNEVEIQVDNELLHVSHKRVGITPDSTEVIGIVTRYIEVLPHVSYTWVGVNFVSAIILENPKKYLIDNFLNGNAAKLKNDMTACGLRFLYEPDQNTSIRIVLDVGEYKETPDSDKPISAIIAKAYFDRKTTDNDRIKEIKQHLSKLEGDWQSYLTILNEAFPVNI